jgi:hypothetical protein
VCFHLSNEASEFHKECLEAHNNYRSKHKVPALKLNKELCIYAQEWADVSRLQGCGLGGCFERVLILPASRKIEFSTIQLPRIETEASTFSLFFLIHNSSEFHLTTVSSTHQPFPNNSNQNSRGSQSPQAMFSSSRSLPSCIIENLFTVARSQVRDATQK